MMKCERATAWLSDYVDGSIDSARRVVLEAHLAACPSCSQELKALRGVWSALEAMPAVDPPPMLRASVWQRIEAGETEQARPSVAVRPHRPLLWAARLALAAAVVAAVLILARVTVPGTFRSAGWTFWSAGDQRRTTAAEKLWTVSGSARLLTAQATGSPTDTVRVRLRLTGEARPGRVYLVGPEGPVARRAVSLSPPEVAVDMAVPADAPRPLEVKVEWDSGAGAGRASMTLPVRP